MTDYTRHLLRKSPPDRASLIWTGVLYTLLAQGALYITWKCLIAFLSHTGF